MTQLTLAIPSKGRLKEKSEAFFSDCGFKLRQKGGERGYTATLKGLPEVDVVLLSAREIAQGLIEGAFHLGITGEDLLHDLSPNIAADADVIKRLGFGHADVVVAVPQSWLDVSTMADLEAAGALFRERHGRRMRVATKYLALTRRHFAAHAVGAYRLVESAGATEAAPASGAAELIVDITSTGATLRANGLKVLEDGVMLQSEAVLAGSLHAQWATAPIRAALARLLHSIAARSAGEAVLLLTTRGKLSGEVLESLHLDLDLLGEHGALCPVSRAADVAGQLTQSGLGPVAITQTEFVFREQIGDYDRFLSKL